MAHAQIFTLVLTHLAWFRNTTSFTRRAGYCANGFSGYSSSCMKKVFSEQMKNLESGDDDQQDGESWAAGSDGVTWRSIRGRRWIQNILFMGIFPFRNFNQCFSPASAWFSRFCWNLEAVDCSVKDALCQFHVIKNCRILKVENENMWDEMRGTGEDWCQLWSRRTRTLQKRRTGRYVTGSHCGVRLWCCFYWSLWEMMEKLVKTNIVWLLIKKHLQELKGQTSDRSRFVPWLGLGEAAVSSAMFGLARFIQPCRSLEYKIQWLPPSLTFVLSYPGGVSSSDVRRRRRVGF